MYGKLEEEKNNIIKITSHNKIYEGLFLCGDIIKAVCVIIGTIIGAGFASGKEIEVFFANFGKNGIYGIGLASIFTGMIIYCVLIKIRGTNIENYNSYLNEMKINNKIKEILNAIINIFLFTSFYIMASGFCAYFKQEFNLDAVYIAIVLAICCYITFMGRIDKVTKINTILIPFLIFMVLLVGVKSEVFNQKIENMIQIGNRNWIISSLEYASYNSILLIPILIELKKYTYKKEGSISVISGAVFFVLAMVLFLILTKEGVSGNIELPLIQIVKQFGNAYKYIYGFVIISAIFTSAISAGYSFLINCSKTKKTYKKLCFVICIGVVVVCNIKFSYLINIVYPIFGFLGLLQVIYFCKNMLQAFVNKTIEKNGKN